MSIEHTIDLHADLIRSERVKAYFMSETNQFVRFVPQYPIIGLFSNYDLDFRGKKLLITDFDQFILFFCLTYSQYCTLIGVNKHTRFLAKAYQDFYLEKYQIINKDYLQALGVCCTWIAAKFNELRQITDQMTLTIMLQHCGCQITAQGFLSLELEILTAINFKAKMTSPYEYIHTFFEMFPESSCLKRNILNSLDLVLCFPEACSYSSEEIFYGAVAALVNIFMARQKNYYWIVILAQLDDSKINTTIQISREVEAIFLEEQLEAERRRKDNQKSKEKPSEMCQE